MPHSLEHVRTALAGQYKVERELGHGGMATVYLAADVKHGRPVAIKVLDPDLAGVLGADRFLREIRTAAQLQHPNILPLLDSGAADGLLYYVMPYVKDESLRMHLIMSRQLPIDEAVRLATEIAAALDYSHRQGMVHRDIKPENILLADGHAVIADFGIARAIRESGGEQLTQTGVTLGSPAYMSPEQSAGGSDVDGRSDLYALGCVLYEMLVGQPPFSGPSETLAHQHLNVAPRRVRELRPTVPQAVDTTIARSLAKWPADRFATGAEFASALAAGTAGAASEPVVAEPAATVTASTTSARPPVHKRRARAVALIVALATVAIVGTVLWRSGAIRPPVGPSSAMARRWVWLADFDGPPDDATLAPVARDLVAATLDQSNVLASVPADQMRIARHNAGRPDSARMTVELSRELAFRSGIPVVVEGRVGRLGPTYTVTLRAIHAEDGRVIHSASGSAPNERELAAVLNKGARDLRRGLGEQPQTLSTPVWTDAATPSFEAFKLFTRGRQLALGDNATASIAMLRQALAIDPDFAAAWAALGTAYGNLARVDSAMAMMHEALRHPDRLSEIRKFDIQGKIARYQGDNRGSRDAYDAILQLNPSPVDRSAALNNKGLALASLGNNEQALEMFREAVAVYPVEPPQITVANVIDQLLALRRFDEAHAMMPRLKGASGLLEEMLIAMAEKRWQHADSLALALAVRNDTDGLMERIAAMGHVSVLTARGDVSASLAALADIRARALGGGDVYGASALWLIDSWLARVAERPAVPVPSITRGTIWGSAAEATEAAVAGDSVAARAALSRWPASLESQSRAAFVEHVEGLLAWKDGRWQRAIDVLTPNAIGGTFQPPTIEEMIRPPARWVVADAYGHLGQRDSAIVWLQRLLDPPRYSPAPLVNSGCWEPFARMRLVNLYAEAGRLDDAQREWERLSSTAIRPDPQMVAMLDETRGRLQAATAMGVGQKR